MADASNLFSFLLSSSNLENFLGFEHNKDDDVLVGFLLIQMRCDLISPSLLHFSETENFPCWKKKTSLYLYHKEFSLNISLE